MRRLPDFLLLDLDDTILDYTAPGERCWEHLCLSFAPKLKDISSDHLLAAINASRSWYWSDPERHRAGRLDLKGARRQVVARAFSQLRVDNPAVSDEIADSFTSLREELVQPFPGALETLGALQARDIRMGLITNGRAEFQRCKIDRFGLEQYFDLILIEGEFGVGKPDPCVFKHALHHFGISAAQAWMIGDDLQLDIRPAQALGMDTVWVDYASIGLPAGSPIVPTETIHSLAELSHI